MNIGIANYSNMKSLQLTLYESCWVKNSADDKWTMVSLIFLRKQALTFHANCLLGKIGFGISCTLSPKDTICMKYQSLYGGEK